MTVSPRETFDNQLKDVLDNLLVLGSMVEQAIKASVDCLTQRDLEGSKRIIQADLKINQKHFEVENQCLLLIATQQPMARDVRLLAAVLEISTELERIGDYAKGIGKINLLLGAQSLVKPLIDIPRMAEIGIDMLHRALGAFVAGDIEAARAIPLEDDKVDQLYNQVYRELLTYMIADTSTIDRGNYLLWAAHNLERMADRVTNICERTLYFVTGEMSEMDQSYDELGDIGK